MQGNYMKVEKGIAKGRKHKISEEENRNP